MMQKQELNNKSLGITMNQMNLFFDIRDLFKAPRLALSGKKIWIFIIGNLAGFIIYWLFSYISLILTGITFLDALKEYGFQPYLFNTELEWYAWVTYFIGIVAWVIAIYLANTSVSRLTFKQLKGDYFFSTKDAWRYTKKHWHPIVFTPITFILIILFFILFASLFALLGVIPYIGEFLFAIPYLFYFFGSIFTIYTLIVFLVSLFYIPTIVGAYEEDTMGSIFQSYAITWSQPWRIIIYNLVLIPLMIISVLIFGYFFETGIRLMNSVFGNDLLMGQKYSDIVNFSGNLVQLEWLSFIFNFNLPEISEPLSLFGSFAGIILAISFFLIILSIISYALSILSVGHTLMFVIFKKVSDDDDLLSRKDEDDLELEDDMFNINEEEEEEEE